MKRKCKHFLSLKNFTLVWMYELFQNKVGIWKKLSCLLLKHTFPVILLLRKSGGWHVFAVSFFYKPSYKKNKMATRHEATITATWGVFQMLGSCRFFSCIGYSFNFVTSQACVGLNKCLTPSLLLQPSSNWQL